MKTMNVRELRAAIPTLKATLAIEHEIVLVSGGETVARILPPAPPRRRVVRSLAAHRARMKPVGVPTEVLLREERDRR